LILSGLFALARPLVDIISLLSYRSVPALLKAVFGNAETTSRPTGAMVR